MRAGIFLMNDYIERLTEAAEIQEKEVKEKAAKSSKSAPTTKAVGGSGEGLIIPEENKKVFGWLKKEYEKGKTEVKVEMKLGDSKFKPGYDLQTDLKSVKDFKPGMFGDVKTSDNEGSGKKVEPGTDGGSVAPGSAKKPGKGPVDTAPDKNGESEAPKKKFGKKGEAKVTDVDVSEKDEEDEEVDKKELNKDKFKKEDKFKKKLKESVNEDLGFNEIDSQARPDIETKGYTVVQTGEPQLDQEAYAYFSDLPMTRKPNLDDLSYIKKVKVDPQLETLLELLPVVDFNTYDNLLESWGEDFPFSETFFVANVLEEEGVSFLVRPDGYDYARYIAELI